MKKTVLATLFVFAATFLQAQSDTVSYWAVNGKTSLNVNQNYFSNWTAGGESSFGLIGKVTLNANYNKEVHAWTNWLDLALGYSVIGQNNPMKTEDKIEFISSYTRDIKKAWKFSVVASFKSQFAKGYNYAVDSSNFISKFLAPAYFDLGPGIQYKPNKHFLINYSPFTGRWIVVNDQNLADAGAFGLQAAVTDSLGSIVTPAKKVKTMFGSKLMMTLDYEILKNVNLGTKLELFSDYLNKPQNIDVDWQVMLGLKVNKWLNVDISTQMLYDKDVMITDKNGNIGPRVQFKQLMMVGLSYKF